MLATLRCRTCSRKTPILFNLSHSVMREARNNPRRQHLLYSTKPILPEGSWDSHMHIIDSAKHPFARNAKPAQPAPMKQALLNAERLKLPNMVFVQLSNYGTDNTWIIDALKEVGPSGGRGVVAIDPKQIDRQTLERWHDLGVRGVRLNFRSYMTVVSKAEIQETLRAYGSILRPLKTWSIGIYADMDLLEHIQPLVSEIDVKVVLEHFGSPTALPLNQAKQPGWNALMQMMEDPRIYAKISAPYLFSRDESFGDLEVLVKELLRMRGGDGVVFGSDWPHTQARGYDAGPFLAKVVEWCDGDDELLRKVFRDNAVRLWDV